jgi:hypothetical protein
LKEKIERFSKGEFEYELPFLCLSDEKLKISAEAGKMYEGSFTVGNSSNRSMKGFVYSSDRLIQPESSSFDGITNTIVFHFNAATVKAGKELQGEFNIISDCGEITLPYKVQVESPYFLSSIGKIKDLFQFTNLARMDWSDAKRVFRSEDFERVFLENEDGFQEIYRNLIKSVSTSQALEEFLIAIHKKAAIRLDIDKTIVEHNVHDESFMDKLTLTKNQWGYAEVRVSTDAPFILLEQKFLWADSFISNTHQILFTIDPKFMRYGNNFGTIVIKTAHQTITAEIICRKKRTGHKELGSRLLRTQYELTDNYLNFRLNRIDLNEYINDAEALIDKLPGPETSSIRDLMKTHLAVISGKNQLAEELLLDFSKTEAVLKKKSVEDYCTYLYLEALYRKDAAVIQKSADTIRSYYRGGHSDWRILWFLLYTDKEFEKNKGEKLAAIKEQFDEGCHNPILYYEAVCIINDEPYLLRELNDFMVQVLNYGIKNQILTREAARQYVYLAGKKKAFEPVVFHGLVKLYEEYGTAETLTAICCMLIKGMKRSEKYFKWYRLGVEAQLHITELYEYYMYTASDSMQERLAQPVLLYFIYNSSISDGKKAFLYANIIKYKADNEPVYRSYYKKMEIFALKMLESHQINRNLAVLYRELFNDPVPDKEAYVHLPYVLYRQELICNNPNMVNVTVLHKEFGTEETAALIGGRAQLNIYMDNAVIVFTDSYGNRFTETVEYSVSPYLNSEDYENECIKYSEHPMLLLHLFDRCQRLRILSGDAIELRKKVLLIDGLSKVYMAYCYQTLIEYYYDNYNDELLEQYLTQLDLSQLRSGDRIRFIEFMLIRSFYEKTIEALESYGFEGIPISRLVKLCSGWVQTPGVGDKQEFMTGLCYYVFSQGKYDETILRYLVKHYNGATREMFRLWQAAGNFELECHSLAERLITQMLFAESYIEDSFLVFEAYYRGVTNHLLVRAFISFYAYKYLVREQVIDTKLLPIMKRELFYEENDLCLLSWLKSNSDNESLTENELVFAEYNIDKLVKRGIILPFFLKYRKRITLPEQIIDKLILTYHADPENRIFINYRLDKDKSMDYKTERMPDILHGIHWKEFMLFYHEELQYYITEEAKDNTNITESYNIRYECEAPENDESNYNHINLMLMSLEMQDDRTLLDTMEEYATKEYMISACFKPIE